MGTTKATTKPTTKPTSRPTTTAFVDADCSYFEEAACELSENNIVGHDRFTNTAVECQAKCIGQSGCAWSTHFGTNCYLLTPCGTTAHCEGCVSGPTSPVVSTCPWPPGPDPTRSTTMTTPSTTKPM